EQLGVVGKRVLRFCDADGELLVAPVRELLQFGFGLVAQRNLGSAINLSRYSLNLCYQRIFEPIGWLNTRRRIFCDHLHDFFGELLRAWPALGERLGKCRRAAVV